tara:strand:- start:348 stop:740 length:393 start_codon:yes stop_codon:yes gene_type:complete
MHHGGLLMEPTKWASRLKPIKFKYIKNKQPYWLYQCVCGNKKVIRMAHVKHGAIKSCGCLYEPAMLESWAKRKADPKAKERMGKGRKGKKPHNYGKFKIYQVPNDPKSKSRFVDMEELTQIYNGMIDEGF